MWLEWKKWKMNRCLLVSLLTAAGAAAGCGASGGGQSQAGPTGAAGAEPKKEPVIAFFSAPKQSGAALWAANCNRCHNAVGPSTFRPDEWDLVLSHMRSRANLTGQEVRAIADYLKGGS